MNCRLADCADAPAIYDIETASFKTPWSYESIRADVCLNENAYYFVAEEDGNIVGFCGIHAVLDEGHIMNVAVKPEYRGRGVGEALLRTMIAQTDLEAYTLEVRVSNRAAISLYKRLDFETVGIRPEYYIDEDALIMWRRKPVLSEP
jgi:ribosomal-protein-alanine N-acetyltransferase